MKRIAIGFIWVWGLWSAGSTLEFLGVMPAWPLLLLGVAVAAFIVVPRGTRASMAVGSPRKVPSH